MNRQGGLEENASLIAACLALGFYLFVSGICNTHPKSYLRIEVAAYGLPISAFLSARTVVSFVSRFLPAVGWWLRGLLRWSSLGIGYVFIVCCLVGMTESLNPLMPALWHWLRRAHADHSLAAPYLTAPVVLFVALSAGTPVVLLIRQAVHDYAAARRRFGSITQAERALHSLAPMFIQKS